MGNPQTQEQICEALRALGLPSGAIVFVHSSMSSIGYVEGGAGTLVDAFLQVLGPAGTLSPCQPSPFLTPERPTLSSIPRAILRRWAA